MKCITQTTFLLSLVLVSLFTTTTFSSPTPSTSQLTSRQSTVDFHKWYYLFGPGPWCWWCDKSGNDKPTDDESAEGNSTSTATATPTLTTRQTTNEFHKWHNLFGPGPWCWWCNSKSAKTGSTSTISTNSTFAAASPPSKLTTRQSTNQFHQWQNLFGTGPFCFFWCGNKNNPTTTASPTPSDPASNIEKRTPFSIRLGNEIWQSHIVWQKGLLVHFWDFLVATKKSWDVVKKPVTTITTTHHAKSKSDQEMKGKRKRAAHDGEHTSASSTISSASSSVVATESDSSSRTVVAVMSNLPASITNPYTTVPESLSLLVDTSATPTLTLASPPFNSNTTVTMSASITRSSVVILSTTFPEVTPTSQPTPTMKSGSGGRSRMDIVTILGGLVLAVVGSFWVL